MSSVSEVSKAILQHSTTPVSNLKLQKLLYYVQGWSLGLHNTPAFNARIEAWVHGPVVPDIFFAYRSYRWNSIDTPQGELSLQAAEIDHVDSVLSAYGHLSANQLEMLSHEESPWQIARKGLDPREASNVVITHESMRDFFKAQASA